MKTLRADGTEEAYAYDALGNLLGATDPMGSTTAFVYTAESLLEKVTYANGVSQSLSYDLAENVLSETDAEGYTKQYQYDAVNRLIGVVDELGGVTRYLYDALDHIARVTDALGHETRYAYDANGHLTAETDALGHTVTYAYTPEGWLEKVVKADGQEIVFSYDQTGSLLTQRAGEDYSVSSRYNEIGQVTELSGPAGTIVYQYDEKGNLLSVTNHNGDVVSYAYDRYDDVGNIKTVTQNGKLTTYTYDKLGQLTRVDDQNDTTSGTTGTTWVYTYDLGGNIKTKKRYDYTTGTVGTVRETVTYTYGDSNWRDKLTQYSVQVGTNAATTYTVTSDVIGNPTSDGTWSYTWEKGRQLKQMSNSGTTATFKYNSEGLRVQKTVNGTVTNYTLHGKNIVHMIQGSNTLHFWYDANNRPAIVQFNGTKYAYIHNLQGDIVGILNASGTEVVKYTYDAWGKVISTTGSLASTLGTVQPFRYRGYVYDVETGLYYLRSRYYNPGWIRFVNKDDAGIINNNGSLSDVNLYAYCDNEPIVRVDEDGKLWLITALVSAVVNIAVTFVAAKVTGQDYTWADAGVAAAAGIANTIPLAGPALNGVITGGYTAYNAYQKGASLQNAIISGVVSGCASGVSIGNLSGFMGTPLDLATSAAADLTFGSGYNIVASSVYASVTTNEPRPIKNNLTTDGTFMPEPSKRKPGKPINKTDFNMIMLLE